MTKIKLVILYAARAIGLFALGRFASRRSIMIVGWHGVSRDSEHRYFPSLYISKKEFRRRLEFLTKNYSVISLGDAVSQLELGSISKQQVVLTFDDGNFDFYSEAAPILEQFHVTATNYIVTHYVKTGEPVWIMLVRYILCLARKKIYNNVPPPGKASTQIDSKRYSEKYWIECLEGTRTLQERKQLVEKMAHEFQVDLARITAQRLMHTMGPEELMDLSRRGFDFQMHTHEHKNTFDFLDELDFQIEECRKLLEHWTGQPINHFCYPSGRWDFSSVAKLQEHSIQSAVTTRPGPNLCGTNRLSLRRVLNGETNSQIEFEFEMSNLRWMIRSILRPGLRLNPEPQTQSYAEERASQRALRSSIIGKSNAT